MKMIENRLCCIFENFTNTANPRTIADDTIDDLINSQHIGCDHDRIYWRQQSHGQGNKYTYH